MRVRIVAVGTRMPAWVQAACDDYLARLRHTLRVDLVELAAGRRNAGGPVDRAIADEGRRTLARIADEEFVVVLDERGKGLATLELSRWLAARMTAGVDVAILIGGPDGFAPEVLARANLRWSLSNLTLPHGLARVIVAEQLYRAATVLANHPYHRA